MKIQLTKCSVVRKTMKHFLVEFASLFCGDRARKPLLEAPTIIIHHSQVQSPHKSNRNVHTEMYLFAHMSLFYNPNYCCD